MNKIFSDIIGHTNLLEYFTKTVDKGITPNFILLSGSSGIGKSSIARRLSILLAYGNNYTDEIRTDILNGKSTKEVVQFNMSQIKSNEEIERFKSNFTIGISSTGSKVLILDEAHGMTSEQQDSILTLTERIPKNLFIILCTTNRSALTEALISRIKFAPTLKNLNSTEIRQLIDRLSDYYDIKYVGISKLTANALIYRYCGIDARKVTNLFEYLAEEHEVSSNTLELFIGKNSINVIIILLQLLYSNIVQGIDYISNITFDYDFQDCCVDAINILYGARIIYVSRESIEMLNSLAEKNSIDIMVEFLNELVLSPRINKTVVSGLFIKYFRKISGANLFNYEVEKSIDKKVETTSVLSDLEKEAYNKYKFKKEGFAGYESSKEVHD